MISPNHEKRALQIAYILGGFVPVIAGLSYIILGTGLTDLMISLESHIRYLSGLLLAIGLTFWMHVPHIERHGTIIKSLTLIVFVGGLARLYDVYIHGLPSNAMVFGLVMELVITPLLCLWQMRVSKLFKAF